MERYKLTTLLYQNRRIALRLDCADGECYGPLTTNIVAVELNADEITLPVWNLPEDLVAQYLASGRFEDTGRLVESGFVKAPVWRVICPEILATVARLRESSAP